MEWIEVTAPTIEAARELALDRLGVVEAELEYEVVDEPKAGLFGRLGRVDARIRARVKPVSREKPNDRRRRSGTGRSRRGGAEDRGRERGPSRERSTSRDRDERDGSSAVERPAGARAGTGGAGGGTAGRSSSRRRGGRGRGGSGPNSESRATTADDAAAGEPTEASSVQGASVSIDEQADAAVRFTAALVERFGLHAAITADVVDDDIELRVDGSSLGALVGPRGATLQALEELVRAVVQHAAGGHSARLRVDVAGYRERRREALAAFTRGIADEVLANGTERALEPMSASDRKVVHDTVATMEGVATASEGEDPRRRVIIRPA